MHAVDKFTMELHSVLQMGDLDHSGHTQYAALNLASAAWQTSGKQLD